MLFIRHKVEGFPFFGLICLGSPVNGNTSLEHIAELFALVGIAVSYTHLSLKGSETFQYLGDEVETIYNDMWKEVKAAK